MPAELSFVIITRGRPRALLRLLESLARCGAGRLAETAVGFNGRDAADPTLLQDISRCYPWVKVTQFERILPVEARRRVMARTSGRVVYFLDDDTMVPEGFVELVLAKFRHYPDAPALGGPNLAMPDSGPFERAVDFLFRSPLGTGSARVRYRRAGKDRPANGWWFTLANLGVRREVFERHGVDFPAGCVAAEENLFLHWVGRRVSLPVYSPELYVYHQRRENPAALWRQWFWYGRGRMQITRMEPSSLAAPVLAPVIFLLYLACLPFALRWKGAVLPLGFYLGGLLFETLRLALLEKDPRAALRFAPLVPLGHIAYAAGILSEALP